MLQEQAGKNVVGVDITVSFEIAKQDISESEYESIVEQVRLVLARAAEGILLNSNVATVHDWEVVVQVNSLKDGEV